MQCKYFPVLLMAMYLCSRPAHAVTLKAEIEAWAKPGAKYDASRIKSSDFWYRIPNWLAGTWRSKSNDVYDAGFQHKWRTDPMRYVHVWGTQRDAQGNVWQLDVVPDINEIKGRDYREHELVFGRQPRDVAEGAFVYDKDSLQIVVYRGNIVRTASASTTFHVTPVNDKEVVADSDVTRSDGSHEYCRAHLYRIREFTPVDADSKGHDLRSAFAQYLRAQGLETLVPSRD